jgi:hypothetical protein
MTNAAVLKHVLPPILRTNGDKSDSPQERQSSIQQCKLKKLDRFSQESDEYSQESDKNINTDRVTSWVLSFKNRYSKILKEYSFLIYK